MSSLRKHIHKDYIRRTQAYNKKKQALQKLKRKAALRNPDEFYLKRIKTKKFGVFYKLKRRANKYPEDDLESILLKKEIKEVDVELEEVNRQLNEVNMERKEVNLELKEINQELEEVNLELEEVNADIEIMTREAKESRKLLYDMQKCKENATVEDPNQFIDDGVLTETQEIGGS
ncbi:probable U3 small nucleolar RNA-associated protein 11 [Olea europaea var. sylvestris]|uniref:probable U3 small nucleolar RNA-associated protein 11 n=1 Tax=Olea europaea var. sylvestris TaxID=158386 RepID=UPI000C1D8D0B|nr:probable U3 small nucleolar RNA-associated protein 11 [Olea europaea var. sylvestris]